jgi:hypothetical protein
MLITKARRRGAVLHYLRVTALEQALATGDDYISKLESSEARFGEDNQDVPFTNARAAVHGLECFAEQKSWLLKERVHPISLRVRNRELGWFRRELEWFARELLYFSLSMNQSNRFTEASWLEASSKFVDKLLHPVANPDLSHFKNIPELDGQWATG